jgi:uncharacterized protein (TIGR00369 family)
METSVSDTQIPDDTRKLIEAAIVEAPFGTLIGLELERLALDYASLRLPFRDELVTVGTTVHGGAIASLVDVSATAACWAHPALTPRARGTTIGFSIQFVAGGRGRDLVSEARVTSRGSSICICDVHVKDSEGTVVAQAAVTYKLTPHKSEEERMGELFAGKPPQARKQLLARLERQGAAIYRALAKESENEEERLSFELAARREEENAVLLESVESLPPR